MIQLLEKKIIPKKQKEIRIQIGNINTATATNTTIQPIIREKQNIENKEQQNETKEQQEKNIIEPIEKKQVNPIKMTDKTKTTNIDRNRIMERLNQQNLLLVKPNIFLPMIREQEPEIEREKTTEIIPTTIQPPKIKRKVVIKKPVQKEKETEPLPPAPQEIPIQEAVPELPPTTEENVELATTKKKDNQEYQKQKKATLKRLSPI